jgi:hypothetical protein
MAGVGEGGLMASQTATWAIPYPQSTDRFCDGYLFTQELAERVDAILDVFDFDFNRVQFPPMAEVSRSTDQTQTSNVGETVPWDTVEFDTASMVNLSLLSTSISIDPDANSIYVAGADIFQTSSGSAGSYYTVNVTTEDDVRDNGASQTSQISVAGITKTPTGSITRITTTTGHLGTAVTALTLKTGSRMYAYWVGDL